MKFKIKISLSIQVSASAAKCGLNRELDAAESRPPTGLFKVDPLKGLNGAAACVTSPVRWLALFSPASAAGAPRGAPRPAEQAALREILAHQVPPSKLRSSIY